MAFFAKSSVFVLLVCSAIAVSLVSAKAVRQAREADAEEATEAATESETSFVPAIPVFLLRAGAGGQTNVLTAWAQWPAAKPITNLPMADQLIEQFNQATRPISDAILSLPGAQQGFDQFNQIGAGLPAVELPGGFDPMTIFGSLTSIGGSTSGAGAGAGR